MTEYERSLPWILRDWVGYTLFGLFVAAGLAWLAIEIMVVVAK